MEDKMTGGGDFGRMLEYLAALDKNNNRAWFHENHKWYEKAKGDFLELLELTRFWISDSAPAMASDIMYMQARDWMYRVARDARIHRDKPPYTPSFRAYVSADRRSWLPIGYFIRIAPGGSCIGTGIWCEDTARMNVVRDYIMKNAAEFSDMVRRGRLNIEGERLKSMPRGYSPDCDGAEWLKYRNWSVMQDIPDSELESFEGFGKTVKKCVKRFEPMRLFLLRAGTSGRPRRQELSDFYNM